MEFEIEKNWIDDSGLNSAFIEPDKYILFSKLKHTLGQYIYIVDVDVTAVVGGGEVSNRYIISNVFEAVNNASRSDALRNNISVLEVPEYTGQAYNIVNVIEVIEARDSNNYIAVILCCSDGRRILTETRVKNEDELKDYKTLYLNKEQLIQKKKND